MESKKSLLKKLEAERGKLVEREGRAAKLREDLGRLQSERQKALLPAADGDAAADKRVKALRGRIAEALQEVEEAEGLIAATKERLAELETKVEESERLERDRELRSLMLRREDLMPKIDSAADILADLCAQAVELGLETQRLAFTLRMAPRAFLVHEALHAAIAPKLARAVPHTDWGLRLGRNRAASMVAHEETLATVVPPAWASPQQKALANEAEAKAAASAPDPAA